jgi:hypothetical protein
LPASATFREKEVVMKRITAIVTVVAVAAAAVLVATGWGRTKTVTRTVTVAGTAKSGIGPPGRIVQFGYVKSLTRKGSGFELKFDPALMLSGAAANAAAAEDGAVEPGQPVPNDNYVVDEGHRLLTYEVPASAHVTALTEGVTGTSITVSELAQLVSGENPFPRPLFEPITTGFWILVDVDTVRSLDQQYRP